MECASVCVPIVFFSSSNIMMSLISTDLTDTDTVERELACGRKHMESIQVRTLRVVRSFWAFFQFKTIKYMQLVFQWIDQNHWIRISRNIHHSIEVALKVMDSLFVRVFLMSEI